MKTRLLALGLVLCLALGPTGCAATYQLGSDQPDPSPEASLEPSVPPSQTPDLSKDETPDPAEGVDSQPIETPSTGDDELCDLPLAPSDEPTLEPDDEPARDFTAADYYAMWLTTSEQFPAPNASLVDMSAYLGEFYDLDGSEMESFVFYQPDMSDTLQEVFVARAKPGKVDTVKAACQGRLEALREEAAFYTGTGNYVDSAKLETVGDWVVLAACPENDRLVKILKDAAK